MTRRRLLGAAAVLLAAAVLPLAGQQPIERSYPAASDVVLRIYNLAGTTRVRAWDRDSIGVTAHIPAGGGRFFGGGDGRMAKLGIETQGGVTGPGATLEVRVPPRTRLWVKSASADVELTGLSGEVEVMSVTGAIRLDGAPRVATLESIEGDVTVSGTATVVRARTGGGSVRIEGARGDVSVTTVSGSITVASPEILSARLETASGPVALRGGVAGDGRIQVETHDGAVELVLPAATDARFDLATVKGTITAAVPGYRPKRGKMQDASFATGKRSAAGGGVAVTVRTFSGAIRIGSNPAAAGGI